MDITGNAFIVGGGSGIGRACALGLARDGAAGILVADMNLDSAKAVVEECKGVATAAELRIEAIHVDVALPESVQQATEYMVKTFGRIDYCVNSAGIGVETPREIADASFEEFTRFLRVHVEGTFLVTRSVSAAMKRQEAKQVGPAIAARGTTRGSIVVVGSGSSFVATPSMVQYTTAKHAVMGLVKNAAVDNAPHGIRVNCACPSWAETPMIQRARDGGVQIDAYVKALVPLGRMATADEVADAVIFLCRLRRTVRHITGLNDEGKAIFLSTDCGDHHRIIGNEQAIANILYSTNETPAELNGNVDLKYAKENEPGLHIKNGSVVRMIDFGPNVLSPMHRAVSLDYGVVLEGEFKFILDSGEERIMRQGDVSINRASAHQWHNITGNGTLPGRMMWILLDCKDVLVNGEALKEELNELQPYYEGR
ncbi:NAD(P)-binding protein [Lentithecium fluviatile CBS 122367]|uniref:NAD(P)-binding protein n=1 Tax=Lentithecium fluviatile CBS 122367 TaxID=1168545 RepID=A0A6G1J4Q3_9PLEO|nr:NAD(P)-binding protein [Lentithecium fluviatile CBS 122367]